MVNHKNSSSLPIVHQENIDEKLSKVFALLIEYLDCLENYRKQRTKKTILLLTGTYFSCLQLYSIWFCSCRHLFFHIESLKLLPTFLAYLCYSQSINFLRNLGNLYSRLENKKLYNR
jgi:hypothetical protein